MPGSDALQQHTPTGHVVGTITYESSLGEYRLGLTSKQFERPKLVRIGHILWHPFVRMFDDDLKIRGDVFSMELPAGEYRIAFWQVVQGQRTSTSRIPIEIPFSVEPGKATYLGNLHFSAHWEVSLREESARDLPVLKQRFGILATAPIVLAVEAGTNLEKVGGGYASSPVLPFLSPGERFLRGPVSINAPASGGWNLLKWPKAAITFARAGDSPGESQIAQVSMFEMPADIDRDAFFERVRQGFESESRSERFKAIESNFDRGR